MADVPRKRGGGWAAGLGVFVVLAGGFSVLITLPLGMSADGCTTYDRRFRCSSAGQWVVPGLPWLGIAVGLVAGIVAIALARGRTGTLAIGLGSAVGCYVVAVAVAFSLAAGDSLPPDPAQVKAAYDELAKRPDFETMVARDRQLALDIQARLGPAPWSAPTGESPGICDPPLGIVGYDAEQGGVLNGVDGTVTPAQLASVDALVTAAGFARVQPSVPNTARYRDGDGTQVVVSTKPRLYVEVDTGCFLTSAAKQRGAPSTGP